MRNFYLLLSVLILIAAPSFGTTILTDYIVNSGFEAPNGPFNHSCPPDFGTCIPTVSWHNSAANWQQSAPNSDSQQGDSRIAVGTYNGVGPAFIDPYQGLQVGYLNSGFLYQTLSLTLVAGEEYSLYYLIGRRFDVGAGQYSLVVTAGCNVGACGAGQQYSLSGNTGAQAPGSWVLKTLTFTADAAANGKAPTVYLMHDGGDQVLFDTPEPSTFGMLALPLLGLGFARLRRRSS